MTATITAAAAAATAAPAERSRRSRAVTDAERARIRALRDHHSIREIAKITVRYAARVIMEARTRRKKYGDGDYGLVREIVARRRVGDLGPNLRELARIRRAFEGPAISVCRWCDDRRERVDLSGGDPRVRWRRCGCGGPLAWTTEPDQPAARAA
jgi:hypothetical protein